MGSGICPNKNSSHNDNSQCLRRARPAPGIVHSSLQLQPYLILMGQKLVQVGWTLGSLAGGLGAEIHARLHWLCLSWGTGTGLLCTQKQPPQQCFGVNVIIIPSLYLRMKWKRPGLNPDPNESIFSATTFPFGYHWKGHLWLPLFFF